jgi:hypothetical protein
MEAGSDAVWGAEMSKPMDAAMSKHESSALKSSQMYFSVSLTSSCFGCFAGA